MKHIITSWNEQLGVVHSKVDDLIPKWERFVVHKYDPKLVKTSLIDCKKLAGINDALKRMMSLEVFVSSASKILGITIDIHPVLQEAWSQFNLVLASGKLTQVVKTACT